MSYKNRPKNKADILEFIKMSLMSSNKNYVLDMAHFNSKSNILAETKLRFINKATGESIYRRWRHYYLRGFSDGSAKELGTLYLCGFHNVKSQLIHPKIGTTLFFEVAERFTCTSDEWKYSGAMYIRKGPMKQLRENERMIKSYCARHNLLQADVEDFNHCGEKTELMIPLNDIPFHHWQKILHMFFDDGFDSIVLSSAHDR